MLRRILSIVMLLCLLVPLAPAQAEEAAVLGAAPEVLLTHDGALWALTYQGVHRQTDAGWELLLSSAWDAQEEFYTSYSRMALAEEGMYLLGQMSAMTGDETHWIIDRAPFTEEGLGQPERVCDITWDVGQGGWISFYGFLVEGDAAYVLRYDDMSGADWGLNSLYRVSLADGTATPLLTDYITELQPYKDGLFLANFWNQMEAYQGEVITPPSIVSVNPATGEVTELTKMPNHTCGGLAYDPVEDCAYVCDSSNLYCYDASFAAPQIVGYLLPSDSGRNGMASAVLSGQYHIADWGAEGGELSSCAIDPAALPSRTLRLTNAWSVSDLVRDFAKAHPDIAIEYTNTSPWGAEAMRQHMQSADAADLYTVSPSDSHYIPLRDKGFFADLSSSETLLNMVQGMYPNMTRDVLVDGKLWALPMQLSASTQGYYPRAFEKVGLTAEDVPSSLEGLLDFIQRWHDELFFDWEEMQLFEYAWDLRTQLFSQIFALQITAAEATGEALTFNTPEIRQLLGRLEEMAPIFDVVAPIPEETASGVIVYASDYVEDGALFTDYADFLPTMYSAWDGAPKPMLLSLAEGGEPILSASMSMLCLNPYSPNADIALELLEYIAEHLPQDFLTAVRPDCNDPIELSYYEDNRLSIEKTLSEYRARLETAEDAEKAHLTDIIDMLEEELVAIEENRWAFSEEDIAAYREIAPMISVPTMSLFSGDANEAATLMQRYLDRQISADQFIREFDRIILMMQMENY